MWLATCYKVFHPASVTACIWRSVLLDDVALCCGKSWNRIYCFAERPCAAAVRGVTEMMQGVICDWQHSLFGNWKSHMQLNTASARHLAWRLCLFRLTDWTVLCWKLKKIGNVLLICSLLSTNIGPEKNYKCANKAWTDWILLHSCDCEGQES